MARAKALVIRVEDRPGILGEITSALGAKNVNLRALHAGNEGGQGVVRLVVDKLAVAKKVLASRGWQPDEEEVSNSSYPTAPVLSARLPGHSAKLA